MDNLLSGRRVLVVEDEMLVLMHEEDMLADLGCEAVMAAATVDQALALIDTESFDLALLDMNLDGDKTHDVADALVAHGIPFAFATGYNAIDMRDADRDWPLLAKPFALRDMASAFARLLAR